MVPVICSGCVVVSIPVCSLAAGLLENPGFLGDLGSWGIVTECFSRDKWGIAALRLQLPPLRLRRFGAFVVNAGCGASPSLFPSAPVSARNLGSSAIWIDAVILLVLQIQLQNSLKII